MKRKNDIVLNIGRWIFILLLVGNAFGHLFSPSGTNGFIPEFLPKQVVHILAAVIEFAIGFLLIGNKYRAFAGLSASILMMIYLPLHIIDLFREMPIIGSFTGALVRVVVQLLLIWLGWKLYRKK